MATDFSYGGKQIVSGGPLKPNGKDMPSDARTRVDCYADIATIPNPYVGLKITVKVDETNNNKMTDYIVKSLKANSIGLANSLIDEVVRYVDYLGVNTSGSSGEGLTSEQAQQLQTAYEHSQITHVQASDIPSKTSDLENDSGFLTSIPSEYVTEEEMSTALSTKANKSDIPSLEGYATETFVTNKIAEASLSGGEVDLSGYATKDDLNTKADKSAIPTKVSQLTNDKGYLTSHQDISKKADKSYVDTELAKKANTSHTHSYNDLTDKPTIPSTSNLATKTELTNGLATKADKVHTHDQYLTEHQDISMKADKTELHSHSNKTVLDGITSAKVTEWNNKSNFSGSYDDLTNKPTIPTVDVNKSYVDTKLSKKSDKTHNHDTVYSKLDHSHTGMLTSNSITRIEVVDSLPSQQENGVLYIVKGE